MKITVLITIYLKAVKLPKKGHLPLCYILGDHQVLHVEKRAPKQKRSPSGKVEKKKSKGGKKAKGK